MASAASRAAMRSSDFQTAAVGMGFSLSCGVLLVVMSLLPLPRVYQAMMWECALLLFFAAGAQAYKRPIIWYPLADLILKPNNKPKPPAA